MRGSGGDGNEKTVFGGSVWAGGNGHGGGLGGAVRARGDRDDYIFVHDCGTGARAALADAVEIRVVVLAREVVAGFAVTYGEILAAEKRGGIRVSVGGEPRGHAGQRAGRGLFVENAV